MSTAVYHLVVTVLAWTMAVQVASLVVCFTFMLWFGTYNVRPHGLLEVE